MGESITHVAAVCTSVGTPALAAGALLALGMGVVLGLLGGGGSILAVPILLYVIGLETKAAIATSLLVVGSTSLLAMLGHARQGHVLWRTGLLFAACAVGGAFGGGTLAAWVPAWLLLILFAALMVATATAMLGENGAPAGTAQPRHGAGWKIAVQGLVVGGVTGLVGAGGGFVVVPALVVLGGVPMHAAVGTSLLVIALNSFAGLAGYLQHVTVDLAVAAVVSVAAAAGALVGTATSARVSPPVLRRAFAWMVLVMGVAMLAHQGVRGYGSVPLPVLRALAGGAFIGVAASLLLLWTGRIAGISGIAGGLLRPTRGDIGWRVAFIGGLVGGGGLLAWLAPATVAVRSPGSLGLVVVAGLLVGYGTRLGSGCTSGHGVCGVSRLSPRSLVATVTFMVAGALTVLLVHGGGR
jgi:hypothetical protein